MAEDVKKGKKCCTSYIKQELYWYLDLPYITPTDFYDINALYKYSSVI